MSAIVTHETLADPNVHEPRGASSAAAGEVLTANGDGTTSFAPAGGSVFGQSYQTATDLPRSTTPLTVFQTKLSMTTPALPAGTYRVGWCAVVDQSTAADSVQAQLLNVTDASLVGVLQDHEPKDSRNRIHVGGFAEVVFSGAPKEFQIQWRQQRGGTAGIQDARIEIWRVA